MFYYRIIRTWMGGGRGCIDKKNQKPKKKKKTLWFRPICTSRVTKVPHIFNAINAVTHIIPYKINPLLLYEINCYTYMNLSISGYSYLLSHTCCSSTIIWVKIRFLEITKRFFKIRSLSGTRCIILPPLLLSEMTRWHRNINQLAINNTLFICQNEDLRNTENFHGKFPK